MKERDAAKAKAARTKKVDDWNEFKWLRNKVTDTKLVEKRNYNSETLNETKGNPKQMWKKLKELVPTKSKQSSDIQRIKIQDKKVTDSRKIADLLNGYFINIGRTLAEQFTSTINILTCNINTTNTFRLQLIEGSAGLKQIMTLKNGKSTGLDKISVRLLKGGATVLSEHLTDLFNMSITNAEVPEMWKVKRVSPILKSGSKLSCSNYRPISIQPIPLKLLEQVINEQLSKFLSDHDLLNIHQSGFRRNHSTATAVIDVTDYTLEKMKSNYVGAVFLRPGQSL